MSLLLYEQKKQRHCVKQDEQNRPLLSNRFLCDDAVPGGGLDDGGEDEAQAKINFFFEIVRMS